MKKIIKNLGVALMAGSLAFGAVSVSYAAENAAGVVKFIGLSLDAAKAALDAAKANDVATTSTKLKEVRQLSKEITGDAAGMKLQKANQAVKAAGVALEKTPPDMPEVVKQLEAAVKGLEEIKSASGK